MTAMHHKLERQNVQSSFVDGALEGDHQLGQALGLDPAPILEFRLVGFQIDVRVLAQESHREPFLPLATKAAAPGLTRKRARQVVVVPASAFAKNIHGIDTGLFGELAEGRVAGLFALVYAALGHLPGRPPHALAPARKCPSLGVEQHDTDAGPIGAVVRLHSAVACALRASTAVSGAKAIPSFSRPSSQLSSNSKGSVQNLSHILLGNDGSR